MKITARFIDVYDGVEYPRTENLTVNIAPDVDDPTLEEVTEWAYDELHPLTGLDIEHETWGCFIEVLACEERPYLVGHEFTYGI